jgi:carboxypeptidase Taq
MNSLEKLLQRLYDVNALSASIAMMEWDQQTYMPRGGAHARSEHVGILSRMAHEMFVDEQTQKLVQEAKNDAKTEDDIAMLRVTQRDLDLRTKIPASLVEEKSKLTALGHEAWVEARAKNDFKTFQPILEKMFDIARQEAGYLGYTDHIYDALTDQYEEGATAADWRAMFNSVKAQQVELVKAIKDRGRPTDDSGLYCDWDKAKQMEFTSYLAKEIGFDMNRGRQDLAPHPFCGGWSVSDIRLTTRFGPHIGTGIFGTLHESGHGMYEQGSPLNWDRTPLAGGVSLGLHESQSRTWENIVGRSKAFWKRYLPELQKAFPALSSFDLDTWYRAINKVQPGFIRVEADECTYNLHVLTRFEIECDLLTGELEMQDLPEAWNAKYTEYLGITPSTDSEGCLQDVHWSMGSIGYFPTYSMGNLLSYQIWRKLQADVGDTDALMEAGNFEPILGWLQEKVYRQGRKYTPKDLIQRVTGKPLDATDYLAGLKEKYSAIYELEPVTA